MPLQAISFLILQLPIFVFFLSLSQTYTYKRSLSNSYSLLNIFLSFSLSSSSPPSHTDTHTHTHTLTHIHFFNAFHCLMFESHLGKCQLQPIPSLLTYPIKTKTFFQSHFSKVRLGQKTSPITSLLGTSLLWGKQQQILKCVKAISTLA